ncbi:MAG: nucleotidyltransferase domain-containing protein [Planctomycetaceae bacterium]
MTDEERAAVERLCRELGVKRLDLFGSATGDGFDPERSDLDFLVEFETLPPGRRFDAFFDLRDGLELIFERSVDLVTNKGIQNPYFRRSVQATRRSLYAA